MQLSFTKMHGVGNDYIYVDGRNLPALPLPRLAIFLSKRHFGVGADGLVWLTNSTVADIKMQMFNADGSEGIMCGNAVRCIAKYLFDHKMVTGRSVRIETKSGVKRVQRLRPDYFAVQMGKPEFNLAHLGYEPEFTTVGMGNPHLVVMVNFNLDHYDISRLGKRLSTSPLFPGGVNVEFVRVIGDNTLQMRVWERGSGETLGCGTGACAAAVASVLRGQCNREKLIKVQLPGGELVVDYARDEVTLLGSATTVYEGQITLPAELSNEN